MKQTVFPECDKLAKVAPLSQVVGEFIEWLDDTKNIPLHFNTEKLLAEFFEINMKKVEEERCTIINQLRATVSLYVKLKPANLKKSKVVFKGKKSGAMYRAELDLDDVAKEFTYVNIVFPANTTDVSLTFLDGLLGNAMKESGREAFKERFSVITSDDKLDFQPKIEELLSSTFPCTASEDGLHEFSPDEEYNQKKRLPSGSTICCEHCGEKAPRGFKYDFSNSLL